MEYYDYLTEVNKTIIAPLLEMKTILIDYDDETQRLETIVKNVDLNTLTIVENILDELYFKSFKVFEESGGILEDGDDRNSHHIKLLECINLRSGVVSKQRWKLRKEIWVEELKKEYGEL